MSWLSGLWVNGPGPTGEREVWVGGHGFVVGLVFSGLVFVSGSFGLGGAS